MLAGHNGTLHRMLGCAILAGVTGYLLAVTVFRKETWIDFSTGRVKTQFTLFPFSGTVEHHDRAFDLYFQIPEDRKSDWRLVERSRFLSIVGRCEISEGCQLLRAENRVAQVLAIKQMTPAERQRIGREFLDHVRAGGSSAASEYATRIWENVALATSEEERP